MSLSPLILGPTDVKWINTNEEELEGILHPLEEKPCNQCSTLCFNQAREGHYCGECVKTFKFCDSCKDRHPDQHQWTVKVSQFEQLLCIECDEHKGATDTCLFAQESLSQIIYCQRCKRWRADNVLSCGTALCNECYVHEATNLLLQKEIELMKHTLANKQLEQRLTDLRELCRQFAHDNANLRLKYKELKQKKNKILFEELSTEFKTEPVEALQMYEPAILPTNNVS